MNGRQTLYNSTNASIVQLVYGIMVQIGMDLELMETLIGTV